MCILHCNDIDSAIEQELLGEGRFTQGTPSFV